jgi:hypothetical protein
MKRVSRGIFGKPHNRRVTTRFRFQTGTLGQSGIHIEPHSTEGHRLGYLKLTDGHIAIYPKRGKKPLLRMRWEKFFQRVPKLIESA